MDHRILRQKAGDAQNFFEKNDPYRMILFRSRLCRISFLTAALTHSEANFISDNMRSLDCHPRIFQDIMNHI
ncbi:MAG: hypothetical protein ACREXO_22195, partial [Advenella sp.]